MPDGARISVLKIIEHNNTPLEFLDDRISLYNSIYPETKYELLGFTDNQYDNDVTSFVVRQYNVEGGTIKKWLSDIPRSERDVAEIKMKEWINERMKSELNAIPSKSSNTYHNDNYVIRDLHYENIMTEENPLINPDTHLYVVDTNISLNTDRDNGGVRDYGEYRLESLDGSN
jgi:hypothetical protein